MGTRGSVGFIQQEKPKMAYNHFDSYPEGLGREVLNFIVIINKEDGWTKFKEKANKLQDIGNDNITDQSLIEKYKEYADTGVSKQSLSDPYCLFRNIQGSDWMNEMYKGKLEHYSLSNSFIKDSLFCEYAYVINLDTMKLEFYDGFQTEPQKGNRFGEEKSENGYYPCRLVGVFDLKSINDIVDSIDIEVKMQKMCESKTDDPSVINYFRKPKLESLNEKAS